MINYIWDFDGTLFDTYPIMLDSVMKSLSDLQITADPQEVYRLLKEHSSKEVAERYGIEYGGFAEAFHAYEDADSRVPQAFPDTKTALIELQRAGGQHFILTHRPLQQTRRLLAKEGLLPFFVELVGPENDFPRKPDPTSLGYLITKYQLEFDQTVMIGDRLLDIEAGKNAKIKTCFFDIDGFIKDTSADYVVHNMKEIIKNFK